ncbi:hypothetical protein M0R19_04310 [Candidatus Pacearchaeota archaeon]|nr:hypothetical protein [Candidatus Pacearchaeota archaeon]
MKVFFQKFYFYIKKYWYLVSTGIISILSLILYFVLRKKSGEVTETMLKTFSEMRIMKKATFDDLVKIRKEKEEQEKKALEEYKKELEKIENDLLKEKQKIEEEKKVAAEKYVEMYKKEPDNVAKFLMNKFGIKEYKK